MYVEIVRAEHAFARFGRMRLAIDLTIVQVDLIRVVGLQVQLAITRQTLETRLVVDVSLYRSDSLQRIHLIITSQASVLTRRRAQRDLIRD